jgi:glycosyltransferase involved in cell wall biosynthesis
MLYSGQNWKGGADGVKALTAAKAAFPRLDAVCFGVDARPKILPAWIQYRRNPPQEDLVEQVYNGSSIYLCPSWAEGWYLPGAEAMACGCALVSTDCGGVRDYAIDQETALLSMPRDPDTLAANIIALLSDDERRLALARAGRQYIRYFTWDRSTDLLLAALSALSAEAAPLHEPDVAQRS